MPKTLLTFKFDDKYISAMSELQERYRLTRTDVVRKAIRLLYKRSKKSEKKRKKG